MAKKKGKLPPRPAPPPLPAEDRRAEAATVAWMLCAVFTFFAELVGLAAKVYFHYAPQPPEAMRPLALLPYVTLAIGLVSGSLCLILTPIVYRVRRTPPPQLITLFAVLISLAPGVTLLLQLARG